MRNERTRTTAGVNRGNYTYPIPSRRKLKEVRVRRAWEARQQPQPDAVQWDEDTTDIDGHVLLDATTYPYEPLFDLEPATLQSPSKTALTSPTLRHFQIAKSGC